MILKILSILSDLNLARSLQWAVPGLGRA